MKILYNLIFRSHTGPTKFMMGATSIAWPIVEYAMHGHFNSFYLFVFIYGIGMLWRTIDYMHRKFASCSIAMIGAILWNYEAWSNILLVEVVSTHLILPIVFALSSLWLLLRSDTGELLKSYKSHQCPFIRECNDTRSFK